MNIFNNNIITFRLLFVFLIFFFGKNGFSQTGISGKVTDEDTGEEMIAATIIVSKAGVFVAGETSDVDGNYFIKLDAGIYEIKVSYTGYPKQKIKRVIVKEEQIKKIDFQLKEEGFITCELWSIAYKIPLIKLDVTSEGITITSEKIRNLPTRNINELINISPGVNLRQ